MKKLKLFLFPVLSISFGGFLYVSFRSESLRMFIWFDSVNLLNFILTTRNFSMNYEPLIPSWIKFSLPDGLWLLSFISSILLIWKNEINSSNLIWLIGLPLIAILSEIAQSISIVPGTFDWIDLTMYILGFILPFIIYKKSITIKLK